MGDADGGLLEGGAKTQLALQAETRSVGLGDTVPLAPMAKSLVMLAEFAGVMYVALVVSRLVGMAVSRRVPPSANERDRP